MAQPAQSDLSMHSSKKKIQSLQYVYILTHTPIYLTFLQIHSSILSTHCNLYLGAVPKVLYHVWPLSQGNRYMLTPSEHVYTDEYSHCGNTVY